MEGLGRCSIGDVKEEEQRSDGVELVQRDAIHHVATVVYYPVDAAPIVDLYNSR